MGAHAGERDELLEAVSASQRTPALRALLEASRSADPADRAKAAELLSAAADVPALSRLLGDADARVRANAAWSLGFASPSFASQAESLLRAALGDREADVVGNAAVSLGRLARGRPEYAAQLLCGDLLRDARASVREQTLRALSLARARCGDGYPGRLLMNDSRASVRRAAAELLLRGAPQAAERRLLWRCQEADVNAAVADACAGVPRPDVLETEPVTVLMVQTPGSEPTPRAPFALLWGDGTVRRGSADRRGGVHEPRAPQADPELLPYSGGD
jgi:HEAT repeat protein